MEFLSLFSNNIRTDQFSKNQKIHPLVLKAGTRVVVDRIKKFYAKKEFKNIYQNEGYLEIYGEFDPYEVTCYLIEDGNKTTVNVLLYNNESKRKRKVFESLLDELREDLKDLMFVC